MIALLFGGCNNGLNSKEYINWYNSNSDLKVSKIIDNYTFSVKYSNGVYHHLISMPDSNITKELLEELENTHNFFLEIETNEDIEEKLVQQGKMNYLMNEIILDLSLTYNEESLPCSMHLFERSYGLKKSIGLIAMFNTKGKSKEDIIFNFNDHLLNTGLHHFRFKKDLINKIPTYKIL